MPKFHVIWEIEIEADSPMAAARKARAIQKDPMSIIAFRVGGVFSYVAMSLYEDIPNETNLDSVRD